MNPLQRIARYFAREKAAPVSAPTGYEAYGVGPYQFTMGGKKRELLEEMRGWVGSAVSAISDEVATIELKLFRTTKDGVEEVLEHPVLDLLWKVNAMTTKYDHFWLTQSYLELCGEAPWYLDRSNNGINNIFLLNPNRFYPIAGKNNLIERYEYDVGGKRVPLQLNEVIFLKYPNPARPFRGMGTLEMAARTVDIDNASEEWNRKFYENSARPDAVLVAKTDRMNKDQKEVLKKSIEQQYQGVKNAHKVMVLFGDMEYKAAGFNMKDMDFNELSKFNRDKIFGMFRVPKAILSQTEGVNFASADVAQYTFARWTIRPKMERMIQQLNEFLLPMFEGTEDMFLDFENPVPEDEQKLVTKYNSALQNGWMTINEVREEMGLDPVEGGDVIYVPFGLKPLGESGFDAPEDTPNSGDNNPDSGDGTAADEPNAQGNEDTPADKPAEQPQARIAIRAVPKKNYKRQPKFNARRLHEMHARSKSYFKAKRIQKEVKEQIVAELKRELKKKNTIKLKSVFKQEEDGDTRRVLTQEEVKAFWDSKNKIFQEYLSKMRDAVTRVFIAQRRQTMGRVRDKKEITFKDSAGDLFKALKLDVSKEEERTLKLMFGTIEALFIDAGNETYDMLSLDERMRITKRIKEILQTQVRTLAKGMSDVTNDAIKHHVEESIAKGETLNQLRGRIKDLFDNAQEFRADRIARTETLRYNVQATEQAFVDSEIVEAKVWQVSANPCPECATMAGKVLDLGGTFLDKGGKINDTVFDYEDIKGPPLHPNCECDLVPVFKTKKEIDARRLGDQIVDVLSEAAKI